MHPEPGDRLDPASPQAEISESDDRSAAGESGLGLLPEETAPKDPPPASPLGKVSPALDYETDHYRLVVPRIRL